jgi:hypothetical protein
MIDKKEWWKIFATAVITLVASLLVQQFIFNHSDRMTFQQENKDEHAEIYRGCVERIGKSEATQKEYINGQVAILTAKIDSFIKVEDEKNRTIDKLYSYILNHKIVFIEREDSLELCSLLKY